MSNFVDFEELKARVGFGQVIQLLALPMKKTGNQWRGACPTCAKGGERALVVTDQKAWYCFAAKKGGDQIALVAHIQNSSVKEAAQFLAKSAGTRTDETVPQEQDEERILAPLSYLEHDHAAVLAIGFDPELAKALGIGYAPKGLMRGTVAIPVRDEKGVLQGYVGVEDARLPPNFMSNVVPFGKKSA